MNLRGSKAFMFQVLGKAPYLFGFASAALQRDYDLALLAFSTESPAFAHEYFGESNYAAKADFVEELLAHMREKLVLRDAFLMFLFGIPIHLERGLETTAVWKEKIAEWAGVPKGKDLCRLRTALRNVEDVKYVWAENGSCEEMR